MKPVHSFLIAALTGAVVCGASKDAAADDTIRRPGDHPRYHVEIEPHLVLAWDNIYVSNGWGVGSRFAIPIVHNGFIPKINNSVAVGFGFDFIHYSNSCSRRISNTNNATIFVDCSGNALWFPVVLQWNFFVHQNWSVFGEPGFAIYNAFVDDICPVGSGCASRFGFRPAIFAGARYHFNESVSLTMRVGFPSISVGVSFFP